MNRGIVVAGVGAVPVVGSVAALSGQTMVAWAPVVTRSTGGPRQPPVALRSWTAGWGTELTGTAPVTTWAEAVSAAVPIAPSAIAVDGSANAAASASPGSAARNRTLMIGVLHGGARPHGQISAHVVLGTGMNRCRASSVRGDVPTDVLTLPHTVRTILALPHSPRSA